MLHYHTYAKHRQSLIISWSSKKRWKQVVGRAVHCCTVDLFRKPQIHLCRNSMTFSRLLRKDLIKKNTSIWKNSVFMSNLQKYRVYYWLGTGAQEYRRYISTNLLSLTYNDRDSGCLWNGPQNSWKDTCIEFNSAFLDLDDGLWKYSHFHDNV